MRHFNLLYSILCYSIMTSSWSCYHVRSRSIPALHRCSLSLVLLIIPAHSPSITHPLTLGLFFHISTKSCEIMGNSSTKPSTDEKKEQFSSFAQRLKANVETEFAKRAMMQREVQMAINIAKARDNLQIFGSLWLTLVSGVGAARVAGKPIPSAVGIPVVVGAIVLGNLADMAYGNKLQRVTLEAEHILDNERARFVPVKQAPFRQFYTDEEMTMLDQATAVGDLWPSRMYSRPSTPNHDSN